jgi:hypothetical protein
MKKLKALFFVLCLDIFSRTDQHLLLIIDFEDFMISLNHLTGLGIEAIVVQ